jgi:glutamate dehydrogenase
VRHGPKPLDVGAAVAANASGAAQLAALLPSLLSGADREKADELTVAWIDAGAGKDLAARVAALDGLAPALDVLQVADGDTGIGVLVTGLGEPGRPSPADDVLGDVAGVYFALGTQLELDWLRDRIAGLPRGDRWQALARSALSDDYAQQRAALTAEVLRSGGIEPWVSMHRPAVERFLSVVDDIRSGPSPDLAVLSVAMREARAITAGSTAP